METGSGASKRGARTCLVYPVPVIRPTTRVSSDICAKRNQTHEAAFADLQHRFTGLHDVVD